MELAEFKWLWLSNLPSLTTLSWVWQFYDLFQALTSRQLIYHALTKSQTPKEIKNWSCRVYFQVRYQYIASSIQLVFFGWVCAARDSKLAPRSKKNSPKIDTPFYKWANFLYPVLEFALKLIPRSRNGPIFYTPF